MKQLRRSHFGRLSFRHQIFFFAFILFSVFRLNRESPAGVQIFWEGFGAGVLLAGATCTAGRYVDNDGSTCLECPIGYFQDETG